MYLALYRKYRPRIFDDVISQEHITTTLKNQLKSGQTSHAYLFTGSRGTGKTTCAKILAKAINCTDSKDGNPCLKCRTCLDIEGDSTDITEIDAASNNGVDFVRNLKEETVYAPVDCKYRVYIIDEVHMLSQAAFNALLKLIEEPPAHVVFIFATTEVHKIPATILSRCQRFEFKRIDINESKQRLLEIAEKEGKTLTEDAAFLISKISDGGMRDALSLLDQCFSVTDSVDTEVVLECAGISGSKYLFELADRICEGDSAGALKIFDDLINRSKDATRLCEEMISHFRCLMLLKSGADNTIIRATEEDLKRYGEQCEKYGLSQIMRILSILSETFSSLGRVKTPALLVEMCLIRLCSPKTDIDERALSARIDVLEKAIADIKANGVSVRTAQPVGREATSYGSDTKEPESAETGGFEIENRFDEEPEAEKRPADPFPEWNTMLDELDMHIKVLIDGTTAEVSGRYVLVKGSNLAVNFATGEFRQELQDELKRITGRDYIIAAPNTDIEAEAERPDKLTNFLEFAKAQGVNIKVQ